MAKICLANNPEKSISRMSLIDGVVHVYSVRVSIYLRFVCSTGDTQSVRDPIVPSVGVAR